MRSIALLAKSVAPTDVVMRPRTTILATLLRGYSPILARKFDQAAILLPAFAFNKLVDVEIHRNTIPTEATSRLSHGRRFHEAR